MKLKTWPPSQFLSFNKRFNCKLSFIQLYKSRKHVILHMLILQLLSALTFPLMQRHPQMTFSISFCSDTWRPLMPQTFQLMLPGRLTTDNSVSISANIKKETSTLFRTSTVTTVQAFSSICPSTQLFAYLFTQLQFEVKHHRYFHIWNETTFIFACSVQLIFTLIHDSKFQPSVGASTLLQCHY